MFGTAMTVARLLTINPSNQQKQREQNASKIEKNHANYYYFLIKLTLILYK